MLASDKQTRTIIFGVAIAGLVAASALGSNVIDNQFDGPNFNYNVDRDYDNFSLGIYTSSGGMRTNEVVDKVIVHSHSSETPDFTFMKLALYAPNDEEGFPDLIASSNGVVFNSAGGINKVGQYNQLLSSQNKRNIQVAGQGGFWSASTSFNEREVTIYDSEYSAFTPNFISDSLDNLYSSGLNLQYQWHCDSSVLTDEMINISLNQAMSFSLQFGSISDDRSGMLIANY